MPEVAGEGEAWKNNATLRTTITPTLDLLKTYENDGKPYIDMAEQTANKNRIVEVLRNFGVEISSIKATVGPTITLYEITPAQGVRISKIRNLEDDIDLQHLDALFKEASQYAKRKKGVTTAELQGEFALGYIRASRLLEQLKSAGVVNSKENSWNIVSQ